MEENLLTAEKINEDEESSLTKVHGRLRKVGDLIHNEKLEAFKITT